MFKTQTRMASAGQQAVLLFLLISSGRSSRSATCPPSCKCTSAGEGMAAVKQPYQEDRLQSQTVGQPMASCWIPSDLPQLQCASDWEILHLQVLRGHHELRRETISESGSHPITISSDLFIKCGSVTRLAIWEHSQFTTLPRYILRPLINLTRLIIQVKSLNTLPDHFLAFLPKLTFVMISKSRQLHEIGRMTFEPCPESLQTLWLNSNKISGKLPAGLFHQCNLRTLWLNDNQLEMLDWGSLQGLGNLTTLRLDQNKLRNSLEQSLGYREDTKTTALKSTPMLKSLNLASNQLSSIEGSQWSGQCELAHYNRKGLCYLEELNLSNNQLQWLDPYAFQGLPALRILKLEGNVNLYAPDESNGLILTMYVIGIANKRLTSVTINVPSDGSGTSPPYVLDVCDEGSILIQAISRPLRRLLTYFNESNCIRLSNEIDTDSVADSPQQVQGRRMGLVQEKRPHGAPASANRTFKEVNPFVRVIKQGDGLTLILLCLCFLISGMLLSVVPFTLVACCCLKDQDRLERRKRVLTGHTKQGNFDLLKHSPNVSLLSTQHLRMASHGGADVVSPLRPTRSLLPMNQSPMSFSPGHMGPPVNQVDSEHERRVNSTGNVYHQIDHHQFQQSNAWFLNGGLVTRHPHIQQEKRLVPLPFETRPLLQSSVGTGASSVYMPTAESSMGGSAYSLVTLTSKHARSPATPGRFKALPVRRE